MADKARAEEFPNTVRLLSGSNLSLRDLCNILDDIHIAVTEKNGEDNGDDAAGSCESDSITEWNTVRVKGSKVMLKTVDEVWNTEEYRYKLIESTRTPEVTELDEYVFVVRQRIDKDTTETTTYLDINSEELHNILQVILKDVRGIDLRADRLSVNQKILFHFLDDLRGLKAKSLQTPDIVLNSHLELLLKYLEETFKSTKQHLQTLLEHQEITYDLLWALFPPNELIYTTCYGTGKPRCTTYDFGQESEHRKVKYFSLSCRYVDFDGKVFGDVSTELGIIHFPGTKRIPLLECLPLRYHPHKATVTDGLLECGRKFVSFMNGRHRHCRGSAYYMNDDKPVQLSVNSRVMIDPAFFRQMKPGYQRPRINETKNVLRIPYAIGYHEEDSQDVVKKRSENASDFTDDELMICSPTVQGFSFNDKQWLEFAISDVEDISWTSSILENLTIPERRKETLLALVEEGIGSCGKAKFHDFIPGKGQGLMVLLHGPPGVGKTLTAEAIAENLRKPLYSISAGELSNDVTKLEHQLSVIFQVAREWEAILLLDEADIFLEARRVENLERNRLVAAFLRTLEYSTGILFLTTNRVCDFDQAILSRIHLKFKYENLDTHGRREIWQNNLDKATTIHGKVSIGNRELDNLVNIELNGREIKNGVATACALATRSKSVVTYSQLKMAIDISKEFTDVFCGTPAGMYR